MRVDGQLYLKYSGPEGQATGVYNHGENVIYFNV